MLLPIYLTFTHLNPIDTLSMQQFQDIDKCSSFLNADVDNGISYDVRNRMPLTVLLDTGQSQHNILGPSTCYRGNMLRNEYLMMSHGS
jgi:hypothetical protein